MPKFEYTELGSIHSPSAPQTINANFREVQEVIEGLLSRSGAVPNFMNAPIDMNGFDILNVGEITEGTGGGTPATGGSFGSTYGLIHDGETDQTEAVNEVLRTQTGYIRFLRPANATGNLRIDGSVDAPSGTVADFSQVDIDLGRYGRLFPQGRLTELPEGAKIKLAQDADAGDTVIFLDLVTSENASLVVEDALLIPRGEKDADGVAIEKEFVRVTSVEVTGALTRTVTLTTPLENSYKVSYPDSEHVPGDGLDQTRISVAVGSLLTGNTSESVQVIPVTDGSIFEAGDYVALISDAVVFPGDPGSIPYGFEPHRVLSVSGNNVTIEEKTGRAFLTSDNAGLYKVDSKKVHFIGGGQLNSVEVPDSARRIDYVGGQFLHDSIFEGFKVVGNADDKQGNSLAIRRCYKTIVKDSDFRGRLNGGGGQGNGVFLAYSSYCVVVGGYFEKCRHGVLFQGGVGNIAYNVRTHNCYTNGVDFHGAGEFKSFFVNPYCTFGGTIAIDSSQQGGSTIGNTRWRGGVISCGILGGAFTGFSGGTNFGIAVRPQSNDIILQNVTFIDCATAVRLIIDDRAPYGSTIDGVTLQGLVFIDCDTEIDSSVNDYPDWTSGGTIGSATALRPRFINNDGNSYRYDGGEGTTLGTIAPVHTTGSVSDGELTWVYVGSAGGNRIINVANRDERTLAGLSWDAGTTGGNSNPELALRNATTVIKTAAEWALDGTIWPAGQRLLASDTLELRDGNGVEAWSDLPPRAEGHSPVTLSTTQPATITDDTELSANRVSFGLSAQALSLSRINVVDASSNTIDLTFGDDLFEGATFVLEVEDDTNTITIERKIAEVQLVGTTNGTATVSMASTAGIELGDVVSGLSVTSGQTVDAIDPNVSVTLSASADGSETDDELTFTGPRGTLNGSLGPIGLRKGTSTIVILSTSPGIRATIGGATTEGFGPLSLDTKGAGFTLSLADMGKWLYCTDEITITVPTPTAIGAAPGAAVIIKASNGNVTLSGTGGPTFVDVDGDTLVIVDGGSAVLIAAGGTTWALDGRMVPV